MSRRPRRKMWRAHLLLARISNVPTVWTNVLAGLTIAGAFTWRRWAWLALAMSLLYTGGMYLNDAFDAPIDAEHRPERPVPAGDVSRGLAFAIGIALILAGGTLVTHVRSTAAVATLGALLMAMIVYYNWTHKHDALGPIAMGLCRGLVYLVSGAAGSDVISTQLTTASIRLMVAAGIVTLYVITLTLVAKRIGPRASVVVPRLIAGISILDAGVTMVAGSAGLALLAVAGGALTLAAQRVVPGD